MSYHPEYVFAIQFLQVQGWALTEYGDSLQSLVATSLEKQIHSMHILPWETFLVLIDIF